MLFFLLAVYHYCLSCYSSFHMVVLPLLNYFHFFMCAGAITHTYCYYLTGILGCEALTVFSFISNYFHFHIIFITLLYVLTHCFLVFKRYFGIRVCKHGVYLEKKMAGILKVLVMSTQVISGMLYIVYL